MRYQKIQITYSTIFDDEIKDVESVRRLLSLLSTSDIDIIIEWEELLSDYSRHKYKYGKARILNFENDIAKIKEINGSSSFVRNINMSDITLIRIVSEHHSIMVGQEDMTRFDLIDFTNTKDKDDSKL